MAEDIKASEEESGRHILNFLLKDATTQRKEILESGNYVDAEKVFADGFYDILPTSQTKSLMILELLGTLSTISGRNADRASMGRYAKALTRSIRPTEIGAIKLWDDFTGKANLDPRWTIYFLAEHGGNVVKAAIGDDKIARSILEFYNTQSQSRWRRIMDDRDEKDLEIRSLLPKFAQTMIEAIVVRSHLLHFPKQKLMNEQTHQTTSNHHILELSIHATYFILTISRDTRETIPKSLTRKLMDFGDFANGRKKASQNKSKKEEEGWRGIRDMADILGDPKMRVEDIPLTWAKERERERSRSPVKQVLPSKVVTSSSVERTALPARQAELTGPHGRFAPTSQSRPVSVSTAPAPPAPRQMQPARPAVPPTTSAPPIIKAEPLASPEPRTQAQAQAQAQGLSIKARATPPPSKQSTPVASASATITSLPQASTSSLSIRARATLPAIPLKVGESAIVSSPVTTTQGLSIRSASTVSATPQIQTQPPRPMSLLSRLAPSTSTPSNTPTNKRSRAEDFASITPTTEEPIRRSLADRLGGSDKRQRVTSCLEIPTASGTPSLLSRMGQNQISTAPDTQSHGRSNTATGTVSTGFTINRTAQARLNPQISAGPGLTIKRSISPVAPASVESPGGFSIKNRSISSTPIPDNQATGFKIKRESNEVIIPNYPPKVEIEDEDDTPIVRKGRGFAARQMVDGELLVTPPNPPSGVRLQDRFNYMGGR